MLENKEQVIKDCKELILELTDTTLIKEKEIKLQSERDVLYNSIKELIEQNSHSKMDHIKYNEKYENLKNQYDKINEKFSKIENLKLEIITKRRKSKEFIENLKQGSELLTNFDEKLWYALIEKATVNANGRIEIEFKNGKIIK